MRAFDRILRALLYIDDHLHAPLDVASIAETFHFSPYYFHRMFTLIVGRSMAAYVRERRLYHAARHVAQSRETMLDIALACGFASAQAFSRAFRRAYGMTPSAYRAQGLLPEAEGVEAMVRRFTNRIKGGMLVKPRMIKREALRIAGVSGDGGHTAEVWDAYMRVEDSIPDRRSADGYEVRIERPEGCLCHVGCTVAGKAEGGAYTVMTLPASQYAVFEVYVAEGYESQNATMKEWLETNEEGLRQRKLDGAPYVVEFYDERFAGAESGSIVEIWIPVEKRNQ